MRSCFGELDGQLVKTRSLGPFVLWRAEYFINNYGSRTLIGRARLNSFWPAPYLDLQRKLESHSLGEIYGKDK